MALFNATVGYSLPEGDKTWGVFCATWRSGDRFLQTGGIQSTKNLLNAFQAAGSVTGYELLEEGTMMEMVEAQSKWKDKLGLTNN